MRGHIRRRSQRSWAIIIDIGTDARGRRRQKWHSVKGTKRDAERELARLLHEFNTGGYVEPTRMNVGDYLERWLSDYAQSNVSPKTHERYSELVRLHITPNLGHFPLAKLPPLEIQAFYSQALKTGRRNGKGGLSPQTVIHLHRVLKEALSHAVKWQLIARNPADAVQPPKPVRREMRALSEIETAGLLNTATNSRLYSPIFVAVTTGLRRGELLALRWKHVDLERGVLSVHQSLEQTRDGLNFKQPKTAKGRRTVDLPEITMEELRRHRNRQRQSRLELGPAYSDQGLVFPGPDGAPWPPDGLTRAFAALMRRAGNRGLRFHDLRHTHATQLLREGIHPKIVSERLGHATVSITLDLYSHVLPGMQKAAAERVDASLRLALAQFKAEK